MKSRLIFLTISMVAAIALFACAPAVTSAPIAPTDASALIGTATPADLSAPATPEATVASPTQLVEVQPVATSRGPNLEATDPTTVSLASGQLQLVEFFRFT